MTELALSPTLVNEVDIAAQEEQASKGLSTLFHPNTLLGMKHQ